MSRIKLLAKALGALRMVVCQDVEGLLVELAVEVFVQSVFEECVVGSSGQKQGHARPEFQVVGVGEDFLSAASFHIQNKLGTFSKPRAQDEVLEVCFSFVEGRDGELLRHRTVTKTSNLRKDEPDPVAGLSSGSQLSEDCVVGRRLGVEEALEVVSCGHGCFRDSGSSSLGSRVA